MNKRRIKIIALITALVLVSASIAFAVEAIPTLISAQESYQVVVNGESLHPSYSPSAYISGGKVMVPLRTIAENLGFDVTWNSATNAIDLTKTNEKASVTIGSTRAISVEGTAAILANEPVAKDGVTFVPVDFFESALNAVVTQEDLLISIKGAFDMRIEETSSQIKPLVADVPQDYMVDDFYEYSHLIVDSPVEGNRRALEITGNNHSDDMFMGFYRKITGLEPNTEYIFKLNADIGTNVSGGMVGIGGSPGSSVYVKAGFVTEEPETQVMDDGHIRLANVDKGNQSQSGSDMKVLSNIEKDSGDSSSDYEYKNIYGYFFVKTDAEGSIYFVMGTDSGFEGLTKLYYDNMQLTIRQATDYNLSTIQETGFWIQSNYTELESGASVAVPAVMGMQNDKRQEALNQMITDMVDDITSSEALESMMFEYELKDNGWLSMSFNTVVMQNGFSVPDYHVLNLNLRTMEVLTNDDLINQNDQVYNRVKNILADGVFSKDLSPTMIVSHMRIVYRDGAYGIIIPIDYYGQGETMVIFSEEEVGEYFNY